jgi:cyclophilin family peptidyl-prolyl cis-trans isomerase
MNKYVSIIVVLVLVVFGIWFSSRNPVSEINKGDTVVEKINSPEVILDTKPEVTPENNTNDTKKIMQAVLNTNKGAITIEFFDAQAPNTVANFVKLAQEGFYDGIKFHRVIAGFMIQGGDPLTKDDSKMAMWGTGGPGYQFADELGPTNKNDVGTISMANAGPNTNGSQFFINVAANNFLDGKHTVFGKVVAGMDVVTVIENVKVGANDRPIEAVVINSITLRP